MPDSILSIEGECVFEKDGIFVYKRQDGQMVSYVMLTGLDKPLESNPVETLDLALRFADLMIREAKVMGYA